MKIFRFKADIIPVSLIVSLLIFDFLIFAFCKNRMTAVIWALSFMWPKVIICSWNHHHQHVRTFKQKFLNGLLDVVYAFHTGALPNMWVLHHNLGHHLHYQNQQHDQSRWKNKNGKKMGIIKYSIEVSATSFYRSYLVGKKYPKLLIEYILLSILVLLLLCVMFYLNWFNALFIFLIPMLHSLFMTANATYNHHAGLESDDPYKSSRNYTDKLYNFLTGNLGYHTAHHVKFGLHWSKLPALHEEIKDKIPPELIVEPPYKKLFKLISIIFKGRQSSSSSI
jgi:fatty acid desaturase